MTNGGNKMRDNMRDVFKSLYILTLVVAFSLWFGMIYFSCGMGGLLSVLFTLAYIPVCIANIIFLILITIKWLNIQYIALLELSLWISFKCVSVKSYGGEYFFVYVINRQLIVAQIGIILFFQLH